MKQGEPAPPGGYEGYAHVLGKYDALYRVMAKAFGISAFEVNRMMPWEVAAQLDITAEPTARPTRARQRDPRAERATAEDRARADEFRRALVAAQQAADD